MPLTAKGKEIKKAMEHEYGKKKGDQAFYASENKGTITGVVKKGHQANNAGTIPGMDMTGPGSPPPIGPAVPQMPQMKIPVPRNVGSASNLPAATRNRK